MDYEVLYEAVDNGNSSPTFFFVTLGIVIIGIALLIAVTIIGWKRNSLMVNITVCIAVLVGSIILVSTFVQSVQAGTIYPAYMNEEYEVVEGVIEDYDEERAVDYFTVNGVLFSITNPQYTGYGYPFRHADGGVLDNGVRCIIYYVPFKCENVMMKVLIEKCE